MILAVNKPPGISSFDVIRIFKKKNGFKSKVGHAGTLDPFAEGLLILLTDEDTKRFEEFQQYPKTYLAGVKLGWKSNTLDIEGKLEKGQINEFNQSQLKEKLKNFIGQIEQKIPAFSAAKFKGKPLYKYALEGKIVKKTKPTRIYDIQLISQLRSLVYLRFKVSSGTYIRQLCIDIFKSLGIDCFVFYLKREAIGEITLEQTNRIENLSPTKLKTLAL